MARPTYPLAGDEITASWGTDVAKAANGVQAGSVNVTLTAAQIGTADVVFPFPYSAPPTWSRRKPRIRAATSSPSVSSRRPVSACRSKPAGQFDDGDDSRDVGRGRRAAVIRADPLTQRDGSALASSNCRPTSVAVGLQFQRQAADPQSSGSAMRSKMPDQSGGTDSGDAVVAWSAYGELLTVRDGQSFDDAVADLQAGRMVHLDVWAASCAGPVCESGDGAYGHTIAIAPERSGGDWLTCDPWCNPPKWAWVPESRLRAGAEEWGRRVFRSTGGTPRRRLTPAERIALARLIGRGLMSLYRPDREAPPGYLRRTQPSTGGVQSILYTTTSVAKGGDDMAVQAASGMHTNYICRLGPGRDFYADAQLTDKLGEIKSSVAVDAVYIGYAIGVDSRAVQVSTGTPYDDKKARPTIVYVVADACQGGGPLPAPPDTTPTPPDVDAAVAQRDSEWVAALMAGEAWPADG